MEADGYFGQRQMLTWPWKKRWTDLKHKLKWVRDTGLTGSRFRLNRAEMQAKPSRYRLMFGRHEILSNIILVLNVKLKMWSANFCRPTLLTWGCRMRKDHVGLRHTCSIFLAAQCPTHLQCGIQGRRIIHSSNNNTMLIWKMKNLSVGWAQ